MPSTVVGETGLILSMPSSGLKLSDYENPVTSYLNADMYYFVNGQTKQKYQFQIMDNHIYDDHGMWRQSRLRKRYSSVANTLSSTRERIVSQYQCTLQQIASQQCSSYMVFDFFPTTKRLKIIRSYKSITRTLGEIGGINSIIFMFFYYATAIYCKFKFK